MNHISKIAEMLGVQTGEYFEINGRTGTYVFTRDGLYEVGYHNRFDEMLVNLLSGRLTIKRKPWRPKCDEKYYSIGPGGVLEPGTWINDFIDIAMYRLGNCYKTAQEAEANRDKWIAFYASDKILEV